MKRIVKWLLPALVVAEAALMWFDLLDLRNAVLIVVGLEALLIFLGVGAVVFVARRYRRERAAGLDFWTALEEGLGLIMPRPAAKLVVSEPRLFVCLLRWALRRTRLKEGEFGYHKGSPVGMLVVVVLLTTPLEVLIF